MNFFKPFLPLRQSALLIGAAILLGTVAETANAQTKPAKTGSGGGNDEVKIGRLPSFHAGDGQVLGVKPNVFLIIDNGKSMTGSKNQMEYDPNGNYLQQTAGALIAALPQLEGKVRLGYSTIFKGTYALSGIKYGNKQLSCPEFKLNGNVDRLAPFIPGLKEDLAKNPNYVTGAEDFVFNDSGSGYGNTVPRDFRDNYARYIYAWLGAMCMGSTSDQDYIPYNNPWNAPLVPPYADLRDKDAYRAAAVAAKNKNSYPVVNFIGINLPKRTHKPLIDMYARVLGQVSDEKFICSLAKNQTGGAKCIYTDLSAERGARGNATLRNYPESDSWKYFTYDAYAPAREDNGFPDDKNPLSCRKNYTIMISHGAYGQPSDHLRYNAKVGTEGWGIDGQGRGDGWKMPNGREFPRSGYLNEITRMYRFLPSEGNDKVRGIPKASFYENGKRHNMQGSFGRFFLSKMILQSYYQDLRSNLPDDVPAYIAGPSRRHGPKNRGIPPFWDRKNDTAPWQHMTFFALGFTDENGSSFPSWQYANRLYKPYYNDLDPEGGILEPYFRAIEDGSIYAENQPLYDWGRGGYGLKDLEMSYYFYKNPTTQVTEKVEIGPVNFHNSQNLRAWGETLDMDYAKAGIIGRGGAYEITDYNSIKKVISMIANRIETALAQGISGGAISGGGRVTASQQAAGGSESTLFTTYLDQETASGNIFAFKNCPLIKQKTYVNGILQDDPEWVRQKCGQRLWNAASVLIDERNGLSEKTIIPIKEDDKLKGEFFTWTNVKKDAELKKEFNKSDGKNGGDALGEARVKWLNGTLQSQLDKSVASSLRSRGQVFVPDENQRFKRNPDGTLERDPNGNVVLAEPTNIPNLMGDVVYALPKAVDNRSTLPAAHPLNDMDYAQFVDGVKARQPLVLVGANDGRFYGFSVAKEGKTADDSKNAELAFSFIPRTVVTKKDSNLVDYTTDKGVESVKNGLADGLVNGPFTVRDVKINGKWSTYVVGTLGEGGDAIFALDITTGRATRDMFKWEVSGRGYGNVMAEPRIVWLRSKDVNGEPTGRWVVLIPTGYNAKNVALALLDLATGDEIARIKTTADFQENGSTREGHKICSLKPLSEEDGKNAHTKEVWKKLNSLGDAYLPSSLSCDNGLGPLTVFDADSDSGADFVFAGDLLGHVWKFDLRDALDPLGKFQPKDVLKEKLKVAYDSPLFIAQTPLNIPAGNPKVFAAAAAEQSTRQPITTMITIDDGAYGEGSMLYFGTGRMFNQEERNLKQQQSFYGIWDIPRYSGDCEEEDRCVKSVYNFSLPLRRNSALAEGADYDFIHYETFNISTDKVADKNKSSLKHYKEIRGLKRTDELQSSAFLSFDPAGGQNHPDDKAVGWIIDFPADDSIERVLNRAYSFEDNIFFSSFSPKGGSSGESCSPVRSGIGGDARFYMVDRLTGKQLEKSPFDFNNDGTQDDEQGLDGVKVKPSELGKNGDLKQLGYDKDVDKNCRDNPESDYNCEEGTLSLSPAGIMIGAGSGDFLSVTGILERSKQATDKHNCDYNRQIIFPSTADPVTGNPRVLTSCNRNRYRVWKQPAIE